LSDEECDSNQLFWAILFPNSSPADSAPAAIKVQPAELIVIKAVIKGASCVLP